MKQVEIGVIWGADLVWDFSHTTCIPLHYYDTVGILVWENSHTTCIPPKFTMGLL